MEIKAFQEYYPEHLSHCYGCGTMNEHGYQIKTYWEGNETVTRYKPRPYQKAIPGYVYGGLIASLIDCHGTGTASAAKHREEGKTLGNEPLSRFVTASLQVDYLAPVWIDREITLRGKIDEIKGRKVVVSIDLFSKDILCAKGNVVAIQIPDDYLDKYNKE
jgi:acyl-coenzyme A thioesterase PaaI-like protein